MTPETGVFDIAGAWRGLMVGAMESMGGKWLQKNILIPWMRTGVAFEIIQYVRMYRVCADVLQYSELISGKKIRRTIARLLTCRETFYKNIPLANEKFVRAPRKLDAKPKKGWVLKAAAAAEVEKFGVRQRQRQR